MTQREWEHRCGVLVVDDNPGDIYLMIEAARDRGIEIQGCTCSTATEAIERLDKGERPRMILFDLRMPCVSGLDLLKILKSQGEWRSIPAIAYSAVLSPADVREAYALHANCVVNKPQDFEQLRELIRLIDEFWIHWVVPVEP